jgi:hypothetical protein
MAGATQAIAATKGLRGVAQDFLAPELRALAERIQGFENLNKGRFDNVDDRFDRIDQRFNEVERRLSEMKVDGDRRLSEFRAETDRRFSLLETRMEKLEAEIATMPDRIGLHIDRLVSALDLSNRLAAIERDRTPRLSAS